MQTSRNSAKHLLSKISYKFVGAMALVAILVFRTFALTQQSDFILTFLDVGQGDAVLIQTPDRLNILIDSGKSDAVLPALDRHLPVKRLDVVVVTHPDADHLEGLYYLARYYTLGRIFLQESSDPLTRSIIHQLEDKVSISNQLEADQQLEIGCCVKARILWPNLDMIKHRQVDKNDLSYAMIVSYQNHNIFLSGDLSTEWEDEIVTKYTLPITEIAKAGHHGSNTSTGDALLKALSPQEVVISAGKNNPYGHPHEEVLERLNNLNIKVRRTDLEGDIQYTFPP